MKQYVRVVNIPPTKDATWDTALERIQQPLFRLGRFDDAVEVLIIELLSNWSIILHWVIKKKWLKAHQIPGDRVTAKQFEPLGDLYYRILELCVQVHAFKPCGYVSAAHWFSCIIAYERDEAYKLIFTVACAARETPTKTELGDELAEASAALKDFRNPYNSIDDPHMHRLIAEAIPYAESADRIRDGCWKDFTAAYSNWARAFSESGWFVWYAREGNLYRTTGKGRNRGITVKIPDRFMQSVIEEAKRLNLAAKTRDS